MNRMRRGAPSPAGTSRSATTFADVKREVISFASRRVPTSLLLNIGGRRASLEEISELPLCSETCHVV